MEKHKKAQIDTSLVDKAIIFAVKAHEGVPRRGRDFPYIVHPLEALTIVATMTSDPALLAAAVLHDVVEDTEVTVEDIRAEFGDRVTAVSWSGQSPMKKQSPDTGIYRICSDCIPEERSSMPITVTSL